MFGPKESQSLGHLLTEPFQGVLAVIFHIDIIDFHRIAKVCQRKDRGTIDTGGIGVPHEQGVYGPGIFGHEFFEIEDMRVFLGRPHANGVQGGRITEVVLYGISIGLEQVGGVIDGPGLRREVAEQVIEIGIDT